MIRNISTLDTLCIIHRIALCPSSNSDWHRQVLCDCLCPLANPFKIEAVGQQAHCDGTLVKYWSWNSHAQCSLLCPCYCVKVYTRATTCCTPHVAQKCPPSLPPLPRVGAPTPASLANTSGLRLRQTNTRFEVETLNTSFRSNAVVLLAGSSTASM